MKIKIPVSVGELIDKITILSIKNLHTNNEYVQKELEVLIEIAKDNSIYKKEYIEKLYEVNSLLWEVEDKLRKYESEDIFNLDFIELARKVYILNDKRAEIKKEINLETDSDYMEVKIY